MNGNEQDVISVEPVVSYPRQAQLGKTYLMTFDLRTTEGASDWPYREEEYPISVLLDAAPFFVSQPLGEPAIVLHRFGGTYGPARWLLTAERETRRGTIWVTLFGVSGAPLKAFKLEGIQVGTTDADGQIALPQQAVPEARAPVPRASASRILRVLVAVDDTWTVTVTIPNLDEPSHYVRSMGRQASSDGRVFPMPPTAEMPNRSAGHFALCSGEHPEAVADTYRRIAEESQQPSDAELFGRYLFDCLIGPAVWATIKDTASGNEATTVEIALSFASSSRDLHRFTWEAMASPEGLLLAGLSATAVIITRLAGSESVHLPPSVANRPVRILFVVGGSYADPLTHVGWEHLELIRHHGSPGNVDFDWRFVDNASLEQVDHLMQSFQPDVVHIVSHASYHPDGPASIMLRQDDGQIVAVGAEQLLALISMAHRPLPVMVLSLCSGSRGAIGRISGVGEIAGFATMLVDGGVPVVVATGGAIADLTSRLFTRYFASAIQQGLPVLPCLASAFRAAFADVGLYMLRPTWPMLFISTAVDPAFSLQAERAVRPEIETAIGYLKLDRVPIFCGRDSLIARFEETLEPDGPAVLLIFTREATAGLGRTRLLEEFAFKAILRGDVPVLLRSTPDDQSGGNFSEVGDALVDAIRRTRRAFGLGADPNSQLMLLRRYGTSGIEDRGLDDFIRSELDSAQEISTEAIRRAMELDLAALAEDTQRQHNYVRDAAGRVVVLIDDVQRFSSAVGTLLQLLDRSGLGGTDHHVPVVIMMSLGGLTGNELQRYVNGSFNERWLRVAELAPFSQTDREDMLACELVWLHPFRTSQPQQMLVNHNDPESFERLAALCRDTLKGLPAALVGDRFELLTQVGLRFDLLRSADDDARLLRP